MSECTKVAGTEEGDQLVFVGGLARREIQRVVNPKAGETDSCKLRAIELVLAVIECCRLERDLVHVLADHFVDAHRLIESAAQMKKLNLERQVVLTPERPCWIESNVTCLVVRQVLQRLRQWRRLLDVRSIRQLARTTIDVGEAESACSRCRRSDQQSKGRKPSSLNHWNNCAPNGVVKRKARRMPALLV